jgi:hypothetical protein
MILTPEQQKALQSVVTSSIKVSCGLNVSIDIVEEFQRNVLEFIRKNHDLYTDKLVCFVLCDSLSGNSTLDSATVSKFVQNGQGMFFVDKNLKYINSHVSPTSLSDCSERLLKENKFGVFITKGSYLFEILCGVPINDFDALDGAKNLPFKGPIISRPMDSFSLILDDHMQLCVNNQKGIEYWHDKLNRILRTDEKHKTEWIFQNSLYYWLNNFLSDKVDVIAEPCDHGQDKHDIRVLTTDGRRFVIEIKWLGKNKSGTIYKQPRINVGLQQLKIYLDNDSKFYSGYLVTYDARSKVEHDNESYWDDQFRHAMCEEPIILFLKSETPSKEAERIVKESKKHDSADK